MYQCKCGANFETVRTCKTRDGVTYQYLKCKECPVRAKARRGEIFSTWTGKHRPDSKNSDVRAPDEQIIRRECSLVLQGLIRPITEVRV